MGKELRKRVSGKIGDATSLRRRGRRGAAWPGGPPEGALYDVGHLDEGEALGLPLRGAGRRDDELHEGDVGPLDIGAIEDQIIGRCEGSGDLAVKGTIALKVQSPDILMHTVSDMTAPLSRGGVRTAPRRKIKRAPRKTFLNRFVRSKLNANASAIMAPVPSRRPEARRRERGAHERSHGAGR